ncbi:MAG: YcjX family protein [Rhodobacteraceae bacterium]|nr:MAG: YcjX family protein [Paracoccaceae bacterium]
MADGVRESLFDSSFRVGITGVSRAGKTVFLTSLVANLLERGRMLRFTPEMEGRIEAVALRPQPDMNIARFDYEAHMAALSGRDPHWPEGTRSVSQLRLSVRYRPQGWLSGFGGPKTVHIDFIDYPGEWLLDLPLIDQSYATWSASVLEAARTPLRADRAEKWLRLVEAADPDAPYDEDVTQDLVASYGEYLSACRMDGLSGMTPGRFLMPGELEGSPALAFTPLPKARGRRRTLYAEFARRFEAYKRHVVKPFFRDHFARLDRQVVLIDLLGALDAGPGAVADLRSSMTDILACYKPGAKGWLGSLLGRRIDRILFAATKADHVHHTQHSRMTAIVNALLRESVERASFRGARTEALAIASIRATVEQEIEHRGQKIPCVRGRLISSGKEAALHPGDLPESPQRVLAEAREEAERGTGWLDGDFKVMRFAPPSNAARANEGPPHIRLDQALEFLLADRLR